jgi:outer membrane protein
MKFSKTLVSLAAIAATFLTSTSAIATQKGDWLIRARLINIDPSVSSDEVIDLTATPPAAIPGSSIDVDSAVTLDIDFSYFFTNNFAVELLLAIPATHDVKATGSISSLGDIGEVTVLPPALIAQYHFMPNNNIRPYAGAGLGYIFFFDESTTSSLTNGIGASTTGLDVDNTADFLVQAGVDIDLKNNWFINFDVKYFWISTTATIQADGADAAKVDFDLDPLVLGIGGGYRF